MNDLDVLIQAAVYIGIASVVSVGYLVYVLRDAFTNSKVIDHRPQEMKFTTEYNLKCSSNQYGIARLIMLCWTIPVFAIGLSLIVTGIGAIIGGPLIFGWCALYDHLFLAHCHLRGIEREHSALGVIFYLS